MRSYTLECNYNTGRIVNHVPPAKGVNARDASPERLPASQVPNYTPEEWREVGRGILTSLLDAVGENPWSRLGNSKWRTIDRARTWLRTDIRCAGGDATSSGAARRGRAPPPWKRKGAAAAAARARRDSKDEIVVLVPEARRNSAPSDAPATSAREAAEVPNAPATKQPATDPAAADAVPPPAAPKEQPVKERPAPSTVPPVPSAVPPSPTVREGEAVVARRGRAGAGPPTTKATAGAAARSSKRPPNSAAAQPTNNPTASLVPTSMPRLPALSASREELLSEAPAQARSTTKVSAHTYASVAASPPRAPPELSATVSRATISPRRPPPRGRNKENARLP